MRKFWSIPWFVSNRQKYTCNGGEELIRAEAATSEKAVPSSSNRSSFQRCATAAAAARNNGQDCTSEMAQRQPTGENSGRWKQYFATLAVSLAAFATGSGSGWASPMLVLLKSDESPVGKLTLTEMSHLETLPTIAGLAGIYFYGSVIDKFGRKIAGYFVSLPGIVGWALLIIATKPIHLYSGRFLTGMSAVGGLLVGAVYLSEVVHETRRGTMMSYLMFVTNVGLLLGYILGDALPYRWFNVSCIIAPLLFPIFFITLPESPYYLASRSKLSAARDSILWFRGGNEQIADRELQSITNYQKPNTSLLKVFRTKATRKALLILVFMFSFQQIGGSQIIQGYASTIFLDGGNKIPPNTSATILIAIKVVATYVSVLLIDRVGRRILMMSMFIVMSLCLVILSLYFYQKEQETSLFLTHDSVKYSWIPLASLCVYNVAISLGVGTLAEVIGNEVIPTEIKGTASMVSGTVTLSVMMLCLQAYPFIHDHVGIYANFVYPAAFNFLGCVITYFMVPETKGKTLEEIMTYLGR